MPLLPQLISSPDRIVPVLITILDRIGEWDPLTSEVARMLGEQGAAARPVLPQLRRVTASANDKLRQAAEQAIKEIQSDTTATSK